MLTIVAAMAVSSAITKVTKYDAKAILSDEKDISFADNKIEQCKIKWPNDIVLNKKKVYLHLFHLFRSLKTTEKALKIKGFRAEQI